MYRLFIVFSLIVSCKTIESTMVVSEDVEKRILQYQNIVFDRVEKNSHRGGYCGITNLTTFERYGESHNDKLINDDVKIANPGTVNVGQAYLSLYEYSKDNKLLNKAKEIADTLLSVQKNGGWSYWGIRVNPQQRRSRGTDRVKSLVSFDDRNTQDCLMFLINLNKITNSDKYKSAVEDGLDLFVLSQNVDGGWPQYYPKSSINYVNYSSLNDETTTSILEVILESNSVLDISKYRAVLDRGINFILDSQLKSGAWAQQYGKRLKPMPARANEPISECASSTVYAVNLLIKLKTEDAYSKDKRIDAAIEKAYNWFNVREIEKGIWSRFYSIESGQPIFVDYKAQLYTRYDQARKNHDKFEGYAYAGNFGISNIKIRIERSRDLGYKEYSSIIENANYSTAYRKSHLKIILNEIEEKLFPDRQNYYYLNNDLKLFNLILMAYKMNTIKK